MVLKTKTQNDDLEIDNNGNVLKAISSNTNETTTVAVTAYSNCAFTDSSVSLDTSTTEPDKENQTEEQIAANRAVFKKLKLKQLAKRVKYLCNLALFKDYKFVLYTLSLAIFVGTFLVPSGFLPARAVSYGISKTDASLLVSAMGVTSLISMSLAGLFADIKPIKQYRFYLYTFWVAMAGATTLWSFRPTLEAQMAYAILYRIAQGLYIKTCIAGVVRK